MKLASARNELTRKQAIGLVQCGILHKTVLAGLGRHVSSLLDGERDLYTKYNYIYQILFVLTICLSKVSLLLFITRLTPNASTIKTGWFILAGITAWGVATIFAFAFQCALPRPWDTISGVCHNQGALHYVTAIIDILTDVALTIHPVIILWRVQIQRSKRLVVMLVFIARVLWVPPSNRTPLRRVARGDQAHF